MHKSEEHFNLDELLNESLQSEPNFSLPDNFADSVANKVGQRITWVQYVREFLLYLGLALLVGIGALSIGIWGFGANWQHWLELVVKNWVLLAGAGLILMFVGFVNRVLLPYFLFKSDSDLT